MRQVLIGAQIGLCMYHPDTDPLKELDELAGRPLDGMIVANGGDITIGVIDRLATSNIPMVLLENRVDRAISSVSSDNFTAGLKATQHLIELGHQRIGLVQGSPRYASLQDRARGYLVALAEAGIPFPRDLIAAQPPHSSRKGYQQAQQLLALAEPPTAIYAVSDKSALGVLAAVQERGLKVGRDFSVVGTDNVEMSALHRPALTTFDTSFRDLGPAAIRNLEAVVADPSLVTHTVVEGQLHVRETTGLAPS